MKKDKLFTEKADNGYVVCFAEACKLREQCLRWIVGQHMPATKQVCMAVNPHQDGVATDHCPLMRKIEKVKMARGMRHIFSDEMPRRIEKIIRAALIARYGRSYYFEYRKGAKLIQPSMQADIREVFRHYGWNEKVEFDEYIDDYEW